MTYRVVTDISGYLLDLKLMALNNSECEKRRQSE